MKELTVEQKAAVDSLADKILVSACAGSGKTATLVARICRKIREGTHPSRIIAVTYTNNAAQELDRRICEEQHWVQAEHQRCLYLGFVGTLHALMVRVLMQYWPAFGGPKSFGIMTEAQTKELIQETADEMRYKGSKCELLDAIENWLKQPRPEQLSKAELVAAAFYGTLVRNNLMTFDMILYRGLEVVRQIKTLRSAAWPFEVLMVDEVQDASDIDMAIYEALPCAERWFCGDRRQAIFGFRGGSVANFERLQQDGGWQKLNLTHNWRCDAVICHAANRLMAGMTPMISATGNNGAVAIRKSETGEREIVDVADEILRIQQATDKKTFAVLLRTNMLVAQWTKGLKDMGLTVASRVIELPEDWDKALLYLSLMADPDNDWLAYKALVAYRGREVADSVRKQAGVKLCSMNDHAMGLPRGMGVVEALKRLRMVNVGAAVGILEGNK